jgi:hypothetical protein
MTRNKSDVVAEQIETVKDADSLADTAFSALFHEARTSTPDNHRTNGYSGVTVQVRVRDGEFEVHDDPVKTRQGEHLRGTDAWDAKVSLTVKPFMETRTARDEIVRQLRAFQRNQSAKEQRKAQA